MPNCFRRMRIRVPLEKSYCGIPHAGTLSNGYRVYSHSRVVFSTPRCVILANRSYVIVTKNGVTMRCHGGVTVTHRSGVITSN